MHRVSQARLSAHAHRPTHLVPLRLACKGERSATRSAAFGGQRTSVHSGQDTHRACWTAAGAMVLASASLHETPLCGACIPDEDELCARGSDGISDERVEWLLPGRLTRFPDAFEAILLGLEGKISLSVAGLGLNVRCKAYSRYCWRRTPDADLARLSIRLLALSLDPSRPLQGDVRSD